MKLVFISVGIVMSIYLSICLITYIVLKVKKNIYVTHRGSNSIIYEKIKSGVLEVHITKCKNHKRLKYEHNKPCVWVSLGKPNFWTKMCSGMIGNKGEASITIKVACSKVKSPTGLKKIFYISQKVLEEEIKIEQDAIVKYKRSVIK